MLSKYLKPEIKHIQMCFIFLAVFLVYLWSAPRTVVFEDDGLFILAAYFNGIAHPPGYPLYTLIAHLSTLFIPIGSIAYRVHILSGLFGAAACVVIFLIGVELKLDRLYACVVALGLGVSQVFWSQSIIAEVYTLNIFLILVLLFLALKWAEAVQDSSHNHIIYIMGFVYGLGLSNHWPLMFLSSPMLLIIVWPRIKDLLKQLPLILFCMALGLAPYIWMYYRSQMDPVISFYGPIHSLQELWYIVSRQGYAKADIDVGANVWDKLKFSGFVLNETFHQFGIAGGVLVITGCLAQWKLCNKRICTALLAGYLGSTFLLIILLGFKFDVMHKDVFKVYPIVSYAVCALWIAFALSYLCSVLIKRFGSIINKKYIIYGLSTLVLCMELFSNIPLNYRAGDDLAYYYAKTVLQSLDRNAIIFTYSDIDTPTLGYMNLIEKIRPDVTIYHSLGLVYSTRLFNKIYTTDDRRHDILADFISKQDRPVYYVDDMPLLYGVADYGLYKKIEKNLDKSKTSVVAKLEIVEFYEKVLERKKFFDLWESMLQKSLISDYCKIATRLYIHKGLQHSDLAEPLRICRGYSGRLTLIEILLEGSKPDLVLISQLLQQASRLRSEAVFIEDYVQYDILSGKVLSLQGKKEPARQRYEQAIRDWPNPQNEAYTLLDRN